MRILLVITALIAVSTAATVFTKKAPLYGDGNGAKDGEYIVVFQKNLDQQLVTKHLETVSSLKKQFKVKKEYHIGSLRAYAVEMEDDVLEAVRMMPEVRYVERNGIVHATVIKEKKACTQQSEPTWGLARISKREPYQAGDPYEYDDEPNGEDVYIYVIDTGTRGTHVDFTGRVQPGADCYASLTCPPGGNADPNGHGTHCASTAAGVTYGVAKKATIVPVRVLGPGGSGSYEQVVAGVEWVTKQKEEDPSRKCVVNMSLGGGSSSFLDEAVNKAAEAGVHMIVAAGNEFQNACNRSPAGANGVTAVGATDSSDQMAYFSNYGECVEIFAPGVNVEAAYGTSDTAIQVLSGTSMASPHVAGVVADILSKCTDVPTGTMEEFIKSVATKDSVGGLPPGHEDHDDLVHKDCNTACPSA